MQRSRTFSRPMSPLERLFAAVGQDNPPVCNQMVLEGVGVPQPSDLKRALEICTQANPGSTLVLDGTPFSLYWVAGPPPALTFHDAAQWSAMDGDGAAWFNETLDAIRGPSCAVVCVRAGARTYLVFRSLHAVMDGQGTMLWAADFFRALRGDAPVGHRSIISAAHLAPGGGTVTRPTPPMNALHPFGVAGPQRGKGFVWKRMTLRQRMDPGVLGRVGVALAHLAWSTQSGVVRFNVPADLRYLVPRRRTTGNLVGSLHVEVTPSMTPDMFSMHVVQQVYKRTAAIPGAYEAHLRFAPLPQLRRETEQDVPVADATGRHQFTASLSHLGTLDLEACSGGGFTATSCFFVPPTAERLHQASACGVTMVGAGEQLEVVASMPQRCCSKGRMDVLVEHLSRALTPHPE